MIRLCAVLTLAWTYICYGQSGVPDTFLRLRDTPDSYSGQALKGVRVNAAANALEFYTIGGGGSASWGGITGTLSDQTDLQSELDGKVPITRTVNGHALSANVTVSASDVGLGNVTNDAQTKAAIVPNTAPSSGQILIGNAGGTAYAKQTLSGSGATATLSDAGVLTLSNIANATLANSSISIAGNSTALGASVTQDQITGLSSTGLVKRTGANALTTITDSSSNWDTAFTDRLKWDGGATDLVAATGRSSLGLVIGTNVEAWDTQLDSLAALSYGSNALKVVRVNAGENGFELATASGGGTIASTNNVLMGDGAGNASAVPDVSNSSDYLQINRSGNGERGLSITNPNSGSSASAGVAFTNDNALTSCDVFLTSTTQATFPSTLFVYNANDLYVYSDSGTIRFSNDGANTDRVTIADGLMVGTSTDPGAGIVNVNTGYRIGNAAGSGKILRGDGTNFIASTPTFPNTATSRKILVGDGTNIVQSTETWAVPGTSGNVLTSDGTNWTSAAPASNVQFKTASGQSLTSTSLVDITGLTFSVVSGTYVFEAELHGQVNSGSNGVQMGINCTANFTSADYLASGNASGTTLAAAVRGTANNSATGTYLTTAAAEGFTRISGQFVVSGAATFSIRALKVTSQTFTVRAGSWAMISKQ